jgi:hypothetical protein
MCILVVMVAQHHEIYIEHMCTLRSLKCSVLWWQIYSGRVSVTVRQQQGFSSIAAAVYLHLRRPSPTPLKAAFGQRDSVDVT